MNGDHDDERKPPAIENGFPVPEGEIGAGLGLMYGWDELKGDCMPFLQAGEDSHTSSLSLNKGAPVPAMAEAMPPPMPRPPNGTAGVMAEAMPW